MAKCPKCNAEIGHLRFFESGVMDYQVYGTIYEQRELIPDGCMAEYKCPECWEVVAVE